MRVTTNKGRQKIEGQLLYFGGGARGAHLGLRRHCQLPVGFHIIRLDTELLLAGFYCVALRASVSPNCQPHAVASGTTAVALINVISLRNRIRGSSRATPAL